MDWNPRFSHCCAVKVKTTAPKRYVVRPPQGCLASGGSGSIKLSIVAKDSEALWRESAAEAKIDDKFLVQTAVVTNEYYYDNLKGLDEKAVGAVLTGLWKELGDYDKAAGKEGKKIKSSKLKIKFDFGAGGASASADAAPLAGEVVHDAYVLPGVAPATPASAKVEVPPAAAAAAAERAPASPEALFTEFIVTHNDYVKRRLAGDASWMARQDDVEKSLLVNISVWKAAVGRNHPWVIKAAADEAAAQKAAADNPAADKAAADKAVSELSFSEKNNP